MPVRPVPAPSLPKPKFFYSPCVQAGPFLQVSGMVALDPATQALSGDGPGEQTARILENLRVAMPEWGVTRADLMIARIFTTAMDRFAEINAAWEAFFAGGETPPARTSVGVVALPLGALVEIEFCFYREAS